MSEVRFAESERIKKVSIMDSQSQAPIVVTIDTVATPYEEDVQKFIDRGYELIGTQIISKKGEWLRLYELQMVRRNE